MINNKNKKELMPINFTDESLAREFATQHEDKIKHVEEWGKWFIWDGISWNEDKTNEIVELSKLFCRSMINKSHNTFPDPRENKAITNNTLSRRTINAIIELAKADYKIAVNSKVWDQDHNIINTPKGIVNLKTGEMLPSDPNELCTKVTLVEPSGDAPKWQKFIDQITLGDKEFAKYLQTLAGYSITGQTKEQKFFFINGPAANGKSLFAKVVSTIIGNYAQTAPMDMFQTSTHSKHLTELANLVGARMVVASETECDATWSTTKIKQLTGEDNISARFLYHDLFTYTPILKLMLVGNHLPQINNIDAGFKRRTVIIPFSYIPNPINPDLFKELMKESSGILSWIIQGAIKWYEGGLIVPKKVDEATKSYLNLHDPIPAWLGKYCELDTNENTSTEDLYSSFLKFCQSIGASACNQKSFSSRLRSEGFKPCRTSQKRGFKGIELKSKLDDSPTFEITKL